MRFANIRVTFCLEKTRDHVSVHCQQGEFYLWSNCFTSRNLVSSRGLRIPNTPSADYSSVQRPNQWTITHLSKKGWHQLDGITPWTQQRVDSVQKRFFIGLLNLAVAYIYVCMKVTWGCCLQMIGYNHGLKVAFVFFAYYIDCHLHADLSEGIEHINACQLYFVQYSSDIDTFFKSNLSIIF